MGIASGIAPAAATAPAGGGGSFTPADLSNQLLWYDFSDSGNTTITGSGFSDAVCKFSTGNDASQTTDGNRPTSGTLNSLTCAVFDGSSKYMDLPSSLVTGAQVPFSVFLAGTMDGSGNRTALCIGTGSPRLDCMFPSSSNTLQLFPESADVKVHTMAVTGVFGMVYGAVGTSEALRYFQDGALLSGPVTSSGTISGTAGRLGAFAGSATNYFNGKIGEIVVVRGILTAEEVGQLSTYLSDKWVP